MVFGKMPTQKNLEKSLGGMQRVGVPRILLPTAEERPIRNEGKSPTETRRKKS
jgi:hypothetical protein